MSDNDDRTVGERPSIDAVSISESIRVVRIAQFLPLPERDALFEAVCTNQAAFQRLGVPEPTGGGSLYLESERLDQSGVGPVREACECLSRRIQHLLPELFVALGIEPFPVPAIPLTLVNGLNGHCGSPHADECGGRFKMSLLYYFHRTPKAFLGGDLDFFSGDPASSENHEKSVGRIDHEDNVLIAFPSETFHGITDVQCNSDEFADGRFAAIGFLGPQ